LFILLCFLPVALHGQMFHLHILILSFLAIIYGLGARLSLLMARPSFGHAAFVAIGAYASVFLVTKLGLSFWLALPCAGITAAIVAALVGLPTLKLTRVFFVFVTLAICRVIELLLLSTDLSAWTGGEDGIMNVPDPNPIAFGGLFRVEFTSEVSYYYLILFIMFMILLLMHRLDRSRFGKRLAAMRASNTLAEATGIDTAKLRLQTFVIAAFIAGIGGSLFAHYTHHVCPGYFGLWPALLMITYPAVGGTANVYGTILGVFLLVPVPEIFRTEMGFQVVTCGVLLFLTMRFLPGGLLDIGVVVSQQLGKLNGRKRGTTVRN
jgi:branched-chain amino acid transport system permease protein